MNRRPKVDTKTIELLVEASRLDELAGDRPSLCREFCKQLHQLVKYDAALLLIFDYRQPGYVLEYCEGIVPENYQALVAALQRLPIEILQNEDLFRSELAGLMAKISDTLCRQEPELTRTLTLPLVARGKVIGLVELGFRRIDLVPAALEHQLTLRSAFAATALQSSLDREESEYKVWELTSLYQLSRAINSTLKFGEVARVIVEEAVKLLKLDSCSVLMNEFGTFHYKESYGISRRKRHFAALLEELKPALARMLREEEMLHYAGAEAFTAPEVRDGLKNIKDIVILPLVFEDRVKGALLLCSATRDFFQGRVLHLIRMISAQIATALKHAHLYQSAERQLHEIRISNEIVKSYNREVQDLNARLQSRIRDLSTIYEITYAMTTQLDSQRLLDLIMDKVIAILHTDKGSLMLYDERSGHLDIRCARGLKTEDITSLQLRPGEGVAGLALTTGEPIIVNDVTKDERFVKPRPLGQAPVRHIALGAFPLKIKDRVIGVLNIDKLTAFAPEEVDLAKALAQFSASTIENASLFDDLADLFSTSISSLTAAIEAKDRYTRGHSDRVYRIARFIGTAVGLPAEQQQVLERAAQLHDIGKVGIPALLLGKQTPLTPAEYERIKDHAVLGARIIQPIKRLARETRIIRHHHERYDGGGYADGIAGEEIPLESRIIAVADAFDAMVTDRPYRKAMAYTAAFDELKRCAGTQFDPALVASFLKALQGKEVDQWVQTEVINPAEQAAEASVS